MTALDQPELNFLVIGLKLLGSLCVESSLFPLKNCSLRIYFNYTNW